jgi:hypothetical protein
MTEKDPDFRPRSPHRTAGISILRRIAASSVPAILGASGQASRRTRRRGLGRHLGRPRPARSPARDELHSRGHSAASPDPS